MIAIVGYLKLLTLLQIYCNNRLTRRRTRANVGLFSRRRFSQEFAGMIFIAGDDKIYRLSS
jgi:hypothetical protein